MAAAKFLLGLDASARIRTRDQRERAAVERQTVPQDIDEEAAAVGLAMQALTRLQHDAGAVLGSLRRVLGHHEIGDAKAEKLGSGIAVLRQRGVVHQNDM